MVDQAGNCLNYWPKEKQRIWLIRSFSAKRVTARPKPKHTPSGKTQKTMEQEGKTSTVWNRCTLYLNHMTTLNIPCPDFTYITRLNMMQPNPNTQLTKVHIFNKNTKPRTRKVEYGTLNHCLTVAPIAAYWTHGVVRAGMATLVL